MSAQQLITDHLDLWTGAVTHKRSAGRGSSGKGGKVELTGIKKLRELILELAVRGKLVDQDPTDEPASVLLERIAEEKARLVKEGKIKKAKKLPEITEEEKPFELPKGWAWSRMHYALIKITDGTHHSPPNHETGSFMYVSAKNIKPEGVLTSGITYVTEEVHKEIYSRCDPESGDLLYIKDGATTGIATINDLPNPFSMLSSVALLKPPHQSLSNKFLLYCLRSPFFYEEMRAGMTGVAITRVTLKKLDWALIPIPPAAEQHRIVEKVDELMALCDRLEQQFGDQLEAHDVLVDTLLNTLTRAADATEVAENWARIAEHFDTLFTTEASIDKLKQTILQLAVMGRLVEQDPNDEPASVLLEKIAEEKNRLQLEERMRTTASDSIGSSDVYLPTPKNWEWARLGNTAKFIDYRGKTPNKIASGKRLITAKNIRYGFIDKTPEEFISEADYKAWMTRGFPRVGDTLFTPEAPLGNAANIELQEEFALAQRAICFQWHIKEVSPFMLMQILSQPFQEQLIKNATGMTATGIKAAKLKEIPLLLPPLTEQHRIVEKVDELMTLCDQLKARLNEAGETRAQLAETVVEKAVS